MRKSTFFWRELYRMVPETVERCACVWMLNGARAQMRHVFTEKMELEMQQAGSERVVLGDDEEPLDVTIAKGVEDIMAHLDTTHQDERRVVLGVLLASGFLLTAQPWLSLNFFSLPLLVAGVMLLGLEFSPRTGAGIVGMAKRFKQGSGSNKS